MWKDLGFTLPKILAWFVTFNFINIAWIFFRAKAWEDAVMVLQGMAGLSGIVVTEKREQLLSFLSSLQWISFGDVTQHIGGGSSVLNFIIIGFFITLSLKNTMQIINIVPYSGRFPFQFNVQWALIFSVLIFLSFLKLFFGNTSASEFIYFNF